MYVNGCDDIYIAPPYTHAQMQIILKCIPNSSVIVVASQTSTGELPDSGVARIFG